MRCRTEGKTKEEGKNETEGGWEDGEMRKTGRNLERLNEGGYEGN